MVTMAIHISVLPQIGRFLYMYYCQLYFKDFYINIIDLLECFYADVFLA